MKKNIVFVLCLAFLACLNYQRVFADDSAPESKIESEIFGNQNPVPEKSVENQTGESNINSKTINNEDVVQIGGTLSSEIDYNEISNIPIANTTLSNPNILMMYVDTKLINNSRIFGRIRTFYDPTGLSGGSPSSLSLINPYGTGNGTSDNLQIELQELKISADINEEVFFTIGRQKVKYGAAKFFNPTDFLNSQQYNFFLPSDERTGVDMLKANVPSGISNFTAALLPGNPTSSEKAGGYFREEMAYNNLENILGNGAISLSCFLPKNNPVEAGFDISQALIGDFDGYFECALTKNQQQNLEFTSSTGLDWSVKYGDRDNNYLTTELEYFQTGPLVEYGIFSILLPELFNLKDYTFQETNVYGFAGKSGLSRLDIIYNYTTQFTIRVYAAVFWGPTSEFFHPEDEPGQAGARCDVNF